MITYHAGVRALPDVSFRRKYLRILDASEVCKLALSISERLGLIVSEPEKLLERVRQDQIAMYLGQDYTLWVNRHYIAVVPYGINDVTYLYVTRHHITEETRTDHALRIRHRPTALDSKARSQFKWALNAMNREQRDYAVRRSAIRDDCMELDLKARWA